VPTFCLLPARNGSSTSQQDSGNPYTTRDSGRGRYWDRTSDLCRVEAIQGCCGTWDTPRKSICHKSISYSSMFIDSRRFSPKRVLCASWGGTVLGSESRRLRVPVAI
jgi:hypothetical protein